MAVWHRDRSGVWQCGTEIGAVYGTECVAVWHRDRSGVWHRVCEFGEY